MRGAAAGAALAVGLILGWWALAPRGGSVAPDVPAFAAVPPTDPVPGAKSLPPMEPRELPVSPDLQTELPAAPELDVVRIAPDGAGLIAGRAFAPAPITLMLEGIELASVEPDAQGDFVLFFDLPQTFEPKVASVHQHGTRAPAPSLVISAPQAPTPDLDAAPKPLVTAATQDAPRTSDAPLPDLSQPLERAPNAPEAERPITPDIAAQDVAQTHISPEQPSDPPRTGPALTRAAHADAEQARPDIAPLEGALEGEARPSLQGPVSDVEQVRPAIAAPVTVPEGTAQGPVAGDGARPAPHEDTAPAEPSPRAATPQVIIADAEGLRVIQGAEDQVSIAAIGYDDEGGVRFSGWGGGGDRVQLYLDNAPVAQTEVEQAGDWNIERPGIIAGTYVLRADALDGAGEVLSRAETPFLREPSAAVVDLVTTPETDGADASAKVEEAVPETGIRTVQPGNTLWALAETRYGDGLAYVHIFDANADQIRDPDLIYPGQIFHLPDVAVENGPADE